MKKQTGHRTTRLNYGYTQNLLKASKTLTEPKGNGPKSMKQVKGMKCKPDQKKKIGAAAVLRSSVSPSIEISMNF